MTNLPQIQGNFQTMSSREIATLCEKEHRHVLRDIDTLNETYEKMGLPKVGQGYYTTPNTGNQQYREYLLTKEQCIDLITGYRADVRIRINRRWQELEKATSLVLPDFSNPAEAARAWAAEFEKREQAEKAKIALEQQAKLDAPKVAHYDLVADRKNLVNASQVGAKVGLSAVKKLLKKQGVISIDDYIALNPANMSLREVIDILRQNTNWTFGRTLQAGFRIMGEKK
ncbi:Rha family transcriptional regulator [Moraxella bovis]|uniref:Rha family transcriptional regulator n=1 Tax=Moraxella bovis TaxID=476 RepID=UPI0022280DE6|nr:Rha family transcriptional regulator [Moraxella bovis]UZA25332.1 Rha family transcriptional regulator [Moraxella bovis]UZA25706.1 Rha family transcriptional regulator [Moraxella bovis]UZA28801.1 Rha family transcriptional regulator [Moraxella bovis]UZA29177.1 Rha family transcriptional regulator [Moraxella bovis]